jgi:uncharacterized cupin superfamily protein
MIATEVVRQMSIKQSTALKPISSASVPWEEWSVSPRFSLRYRALSGATIGQDCHIGMAIEELRSGTQSAPAHYHIFEEEHVYLLEGSLTARIGGETFAMAAGDYVCFPAGQKAGHCLINNSGAACRYVILGERNSNEVVVYTDSQKILARALGRRAIFDLTAKRGYWDGENTGLPEGQIPQSDIAPSPPEVPVKPHPPISSRDVEWEHAREGTQFGGMAKHLTHAAVGKDYHVGVLIESPAPGMRLAPKHYHMLEEEHALILEGQVTLLLGTEQYEMKAGDYVGFPAGRRIAHAFMNGGSGPCSYLMIGERNPNDVCVYPDSNKMAVNALGSENAIFDMSGVRSYWDGER